MKKNYFLAFALLITGSVIAQINENTNVNQPINKDFGRTTPHLNPIIRASGDVIVSDDFSAGFANWTTSNLTTGIQGAFQTGVVPGGVSNDLNLYMGYIESGTPTNGIAFFNGVQYLLNSYVGIQDAALTWSGPSIDLSSINYVSIEFAHRYRAFNSDEIFVEVSNDGGATWTTYPINASQTTNAAAVDEIKRIEISSVAANQPNVTVRFRWTETSGDDYLGSGYGWQIDDFAVIESYENDMEISDAWPIFGALNLDYHYIPESFLTSGDINVSGKIKNSGIFTQNNAVLKSNVEFGGSNVFSGSSATGTNILPASEDSISLATGFAPTSGQGVYSFSAYADADEVEQADDNDSTYFNVEITQNIYSRDDGMVTGSIGNVSTAPSGDLQIGNVMEMPTSGAFNTVQLGISNQSDFNQLVFVEIRKYNTTTQDYDYVTSTNDYTIQPGDVGQLVTLNLGSTVNYQAGDEYLVLASHYGGQSTRFMMAQKTQTYTVMGYQAGSMFYLNNPSAIVVRIVLPDFDNDMMLSNAWPLFGSEKLDYHFIPESFLSASDITISGRIRNNGVLVQNNAVLSADIDFSGSNVFSGTSAIGTNLPPTTVDSISLTSNFGPTSGIGTYSFTSYASADEIDDNNSNDTMYFDVDITQNVYGRDDGNTTGSISNFTTFSTGSLKIGNVMEMPINGSFGNVQIGIANQSEVNQPVYAEIRKYNSTTQVYEFVTSTNDYSIQASDLGELITLDLNDAVNFQAGDKYLVLAGHYGGVNSPSFMMAQPSEYGTVLGYQGGFIHYPQNPDAIIIRIVLPEFENDMEISNAWPLFGTSNLDYFFIPESFLTSSDITITGEIRNNGGLVQNNAMLKSDIAFSGANVYSGSSATGTNLDPVTVDSSSLTSVFGPASGQGVYSFTSYAVSDEIDDDNSNDTMYFDVEVTESIYSRDNGIISGFIANTNSAPTGDLKIGNVMEMPVNGVFGRVLIGVSSQSVAYKKIYAEIRKLNTTTGDYELLTQTDDFMIQPSNVGSLVTLDLNNMVNYQAGDKYLVLACHYGGNNSPRFMLAQHTQTGSVVGYQSGSMFYNENPAAVVIRLDNRDFSSINDENLDGSTIGQNVPNPFNNSSYINYSLNEASNVNFTVIDMTGKVVMDVNQGNQAAGEHRIDLSADKFAEGVYFYSFTIGDKKVTKKMVVTK